jgi:hypothetical protein
VDAATGPKPRLYQPGTAGGRVLIDHLAPAGGATKNPGIEPPISHRDVTTIMALLGDIQDDVRLIRKLMEAEYGEEEGAPEDDR